MNKSSQRALRITCFLLLVIMGSHAYAYREISLKSIDDSSHRLTEYIGKGKWVVLNIWGTDCPPCREEVPELVRFHDEHEETNAIVVGIAIDFPSFGYARKDEVIAFADDYFIDFPILLSDARVTENIGLGALSGLPTTYLFDPEGKLAGMQVGGITKKILEDFINKSSLPSSGSNNKQSGE